MTKSEVKPEGPGGSLSFPLALRDPCISVKELCWLGCENVVL